MKILVVEDDLKTADHLIFGLRNEYINVEHAADGSSAIEKISNNIYDLIISDLVLPFKNADEIIQHLRSTGKNIPVIILSAVQDLEAKIKLFSLGIDDYITKPFSFPELLARTKTLLRKNKIDTGSTLAYQDLQYDLKKQEVLRDGIKLTLRAKELKILEYLMRHNGQVLTREMIKNYVWGSDIERRTNVVDVHIHHLRKKIDYKFSKKLIKTISCTGYKFGI